jgi:twinkle protein
MKKLTNNVIQFAEKRGITEQTLKNLKCEAGMGQYGDRQLESIVFNYFNTKGEKVNYKARAIAEKTFKQLKGGKQQFYNIENVINSNNLSTVYIVEGEFDLAAMLESGYPIDSVLSVPSGAPATETDNAESAKRYEYILESLEQGLDKAHCFVLLTDNDDPGRNLRADLSSILGHAKCKFAEFPPDVKDINEYMLKVGKDQLQWFINEGLQDYPIEGVYTLNDIPEPSPPKIWNPQFDGWDNKVMLGAGMLSVFTGYPGHGKTTFAQQLWANIVKEYKIQVGLFSGETRVKPYVRRNLRTFYHGKQERDMTEGELNEADTWIGNNFHFLNHPNNAPEFEWVCDKIRDMKARFGIEAFMFDPWNKLEMPDLNRNTETNWIGKCLDDLATLAKVLDVHIMILAHPSKPSEYKVGNNAPTAYSIAGSAHWYNKPDHIFSLWRPKFEDEDGNRLTEAKLVVWKTRYEELGYPRTLEVRLNMQNGCFESVDKQQVYQSNRKDIYG